MCGARVVDVNADAIAGQRRLGGARADSGTCISSGGISGTTTTTTTTTTTRVRSCDRRPDTHPFQQHGLRRDRIASGTGQPRELRRLRWK